jgi:hypothetical protein
MVLLLQLAVVLHCGSYHTAMLPLAPLVTTLEGLEKIMEEGKCWHQFQKGTINKHQT